MPKTNEKSVAVSEKMVNLVSKTTKNGNIVISMEDSKYYYLPFDKSPLAELTLVCTVLTLELAFEAREINSALSSTTVCAIIPPLRYNIIA